MPPDGARGFPDGALAEISAETQRRRLAAAERSPDEGRAQSPERRRGVHRAPADVVHHIEALRRVQAPCLGQGGALPEHVMQMNRPFAVRRIPRVPELRQLDPDETERSVAVLRHGRFDRRSAKRMRNDPYVVSLGQVPRPVPDESGLGSRVRRADVPDQQDAQFLLHILMRLAMRHSWGYRAFRAVRRGPSLYDACRVARRRIRAECGSCGMNPQSDCVLELLLLHDGIARARLCSACTSKVDLSARAPQARPAFFCLRGMLFHGSSVDWSSRL
jgi:hypothetical protein